MTTIGCDLGATELISACRDTDGGGINHRRLPCVYVEVTTAAVPQLQAAQMSPVVVGGHLLVLGDEAVAAARLLGVSVQRPLVTGGLNQQDTTGPLALGELLRLLLGPASDSEQCFFTMIPPVLDSVLDLAYYRAYVSRTLSLLGYTSRAVSTPLAMAYSTGPAPTVLTLYFELGLAVVGLCYAGKPLMEFSFCAASGHAVDCAAALALGYAVEAVHAQRCRTVEPLDFTNPSTPSDAVISHYQHVALTQLSARLAVELTTVAALPAAPIVILVGGPEATGLHFIDLVRQVYQETAARWPLTVATVTLAASPALATVTGLLNVPQE